MSEEKHPPTPVAGRDEVQTSPHEVTVPSIPSGPRANEPVPSEAPLTLPPAAPPPSDQRVNALETEPARLEPPDAISAEPMAPAPQPEAVTGSTSGTGEAVPDVTVLPDEVPVGTAIRTPAAAGVTPASPPKGVQVFEDTVTLLEISPADSGGITEAPLPGNRAGSPPPPLPARRIGWNQPVARWVASVLFVIALIFVFLWLLFDLFRFG
ncbi:MAG TPA: hypothetical protein VGR61_06755 [Candidatus Dormibacteraeota bacterium]|nr:hypothetical protein [Candidatus Dormibacteraeota bacterium]